MQTKETLRKHHKLQRAAMTEKTVQKLSGRICDRVKERFLQEIDQIRISGVYGYYPLGQEVSLVELFQWLLAEQIPLAFPRVSGKTMEFYQIRSLAELEEGCFHVMEPVAGVEQVDWNSAYVLTPGVAFDRSGSRIGYGKGYYDGYFRNHPKLRRIGIAYENQICEEDIPADSFDIRVQQIITESDMERKTNESKSKKRI